MIIRRLIMPLTLAMFVSQALEANAQGAFPAPLPGAAAAPASSSPFPPVNGGGGGSPFPPVNGAGGGGSPFPPVNGAAPAASAPASAFPSAGAPPVTGGFAPPQQAGPPGGDACMSGFAPLREDAEKRGLAIKNASARRAPPAEACKLITAYAQSEIRMIKYIAANKTKCGIPDNVAAQMKTGHNGTEQMRKQVCNVAQQQQQQPRGAAAPSLSEVLGSSSMGMPEASATKRGGSTFDTLNGNVLTR